MIIFFSFISFFTSAQKQYPLDSLNLRETNALFADDYGDFYLYKNTDLSFAKYDSTDLQLSKIMFTVPFKVQSVENPLNIFAFSENAQEMRLYDENLVEIQRINLRQDFGSIVMAYGADLQYFWLLEDSTKRLIKYRFRDKNIQNSYLMNFGFEDIRYMIVYRNLIYILKEKEFAVYDLQSNLIFKKEIVNGKKLHRENNDFFIIEDKKIGKYNSAGIFAEVFKNQNAKIVDKNSNNFLAIVKNKLYIYRIENK
ncbi:hypothetical protein [Halpernia frigidisoli]|uniref:hypothetical protein n=1 Tax=Halpernia frigidisoli TaxID=1125876 RepID=UPI00116096E1|nr:hypothetical protein [Halpernia frigidisoli]